MRYSIIWGNGPAAGAAAAATTALLTLGAAAAALAAAPPATAQTTATAGANDPLLSSWQTRYSGRYARVVEQDGAQPVTTWPSTNLPNHGGGQSLPAYSDVQQIGFSDAFVYINGTGLASHQMGPWYDGIGRIFGNWPANLNYIRRFPRHPQAAAVKTVNGLGALGLWVNGVSLFNLLDGAYYDPSTGTEPHAPPQQMTSGSTALWVRNAVVVEQPTFDKSNAHQPGNGEYHYHDNPVALRWQMGDNVAQDSATGSYHEDTSHLHHSPILGWSYDGYPIYGPYGYSDPKSPKSGIRRMVSGYVIRDGARGTTDLRRSGRHTLARWAAALHGVSPQLTASQYGPNVSAQYTLGRYVEDFDFLGDHGYTQGKDFDLDLYNGRWCVTPEFPRGTYAYFVTLNADGSPAFPYVIGRQWYGVPSGGAVRQLAEPVTLYLNAGPASGVTVDVARTADGVRLTWTSVEGGHYRIEGANSDRVTAAYWAPIAADVSSQGLMTSFRIPASSGAAAYRYYRVTLISLDPYDSTGHAAGGQP